MLLPLQCFQCINVTCQAPNILTIMHPDRHNYKIIICTTTDTEFLWCEASQTCSADSLCKWDLLFLLPLHVPYMLIYLTFVYPNMSSWWAAFICWDVCYLPAWFYSTAWVSLKTADLNHHRYSHGSTPTKFPALLNQVCGMPTEKVNRSDKGKVMNSCVDSNLSFILNKGIK